MTGLEGLQFFLYMMSGGFVVGVVWSIFFSWAKY